MTREELEKNNGRNGHPAYVAVSGVIYDVSASALWPEGSHEGAHLAGADPTEELKSAPHVRAVIERFPVVGQLSTTPQTTPKKFPLMPMIVVAIIAMVLLAILIL